MPQPTIAECYDNIVEAPSLLQLFLEKEWMSIQELPLLALSNLGLFQRGFWPT